MEFLLRQTARGTLRFKKPIQLFDFISRKAEKKIIKFYVLFLVVGAIIYRSTLYLRTKLPRHQPVVIMYIN